MGDKNGSSTVVEVKIFSYIYSLLLGKYLMESKIIEYLDNSFINSTFLYKYKVKQAEVISRLLFTFITLKLQEYFVQSLTVSKYIFTCFAIMMPGFEKILIQSYLVEKIWIQSHFEYIQNAQPNCC